MHHHILPGLSGAIAMVLAAPAAAQQGAGATATFSIPPGPMAEALKAFAAQSGQQILYNSDLVAQLASPGARGRLAPEEALRQLLAGTPLIVERQASGVIVLKRQPTVPDALPQADPAAPTALLTPTSPVTEVEDLVVTGTLIRGLADGPSPLVSLGREDIDRSGHATVAEALSALPQNFAGAATPETGLTLADPTGSNSYFSSGVNLRGLGPEATLVLINGRRLAGSGVYGDFSDVSVAPTAAVERIDVLLDGASALYGSDAVAGVVNIILRRDFEGAETRLRLGTARGGAEEVQAAHTFGVNWSRGSLVASYEFYRRNALANADRAFAESADLRRFGGADRRTRFGHPGNIVVTDPALGPTVRWAIPQGQSGLGLAPGDFLAGQTNFGEPSKGADLLPNQQKHALFAAAEQQLGERLTVSGDLRVSRRTFDYNAAPPTATLTVNRGNPFFVSPNGSSSHQIAYGFYDELGSQLSRGRSENWGASLGAELELFGDWRLEGYGAFGQEKGRNLASHLVNTVFLREALGASADDPATSYVAARDGYFNPFGDTGANGAAVLDFIGSGYTNVFFRTRVTSANLLLDGTLAQLPGGPLKAAFGANARRETFAYRSVSLRTTSTPRSRVQPTYERDVTALFAELRAPLVGPANARPGLERLELSAALRGEDYGDFGSTTNPKVGLVYQPIEALTLRASHGRSFRAPALPEIFDPASISATFLPTTSGQALTLFFSGGNLDLEPETATSNTLSLDFRPAWADGLRLTLTGFDIRYRERIGQPVLFGLSQALVDPAFASFVTRLDPTRPEDRARIEALIADPRYGLPGVYPADAFGALVEARYINAADLHVRGLDVTGDYARDLAGGRLELSANLSLLDRYRWRLTPDAGWTSALDTAGSPVDLRGRVAARWSLGPVSLSTTMNYVDDYRALSGARIDAWTTFDLQAQWRSPRQSGPAAGLTVTATVQNLFDTDPPFHNPAAPSTVGYDPTNATALGRFVALQLTKRW